VSGRDKRGHENDRTLPLEIWKPVLPARIILWVCAALFVLWILRVARRALFPFILGMVIAYILSPLVNFLEGKLPLPPRARRLARPLAILIAYFMVVLAVGGMLAFFVPVIVDQIQFVREKGPLYAEKGWALWNEWFGQYQEALPLYIRQALQDNLKEMSGVVLRAVQQGIAGTLSLVTHTLSFVFGLFVIPFWLFYVLKDQKRMGEALFSLIPRRYQADVENIFCLIDSVLSAYLRGQLILCFWVGAMVTLGLMLLRVDLAILLGTMAGVLEIIPTIGPILGAIPAVLMALLRSPVTALWTVVLFILIQQIENFFLVPRVAASAVRLHPALVMVVLVVGSEVAGVWGMLLAVPVTAMLRDVFKYLYLRVSDEALTPGEALHRVQNPERPCEA